MFEKDLKCALSTFEKINYPEFDKTFIKNSQLACTCKKEVGKGKSGSLFGESFTQSNYEKIGIRN